MTRGLIPFTRDARLKRLYDLANLLRTLMDAPVKGGKRERTGANIYIDEKLDSPLIYRAHLLDDPNSKRTNDRALLVSYVKTPSGSMGAEETRRVINELITYDHIPNLSFLFVAQESRASATLVLEDLGGDLLQKVLPGLSFPEILSILLQLFLAVRVFSTMNLFLYRFSLEDVRVISLGRGVRYIDKRDEFYLNGFLPVITLPSFVHVSQHVSLPDTKAVLSRFIALGLPPTDLQETSLYWTFDALQILDAFIEAPLDPKRTQNLISLRKFIQTSPSLHEVLAHIYGSRFNDGGNTFTLQEIYSRQRKNLDTYNVDPTESPSTLLQTLSRETPQDFGGIISFYTEEFFYGLTSKPLDDETLKAWSKVWGVDLEKGRNLEKMIKTLFDLYITRVHRALIDSFPMGGSNEIARYLISCRALLKTILETKHKPVLGINPETALLTIGLKRTGKWAVFEFLVARTLAHRRMSYGVYALLVALVLAANEESPEWRELARVPEVQSTLGYSRFYDLTRFSPDLFVDTLVDGLLLESKLPLDDLTAVDSFILRDEEER